MRSNLLASLVPLLAVLAGCGSLDAFNSGPFASGTAVDTDGGTTAGDDDDDNGGGGGGGDDDDDTTGGGCTAPDLWDLGAQDPQSGGNMDPAYIGVSMDGVIEGTDVLDYSVDGSDLAAHVTFTLYDATFAPMCQVVFDASDSATTTAPWGSDSTGVIYKAWNLNLAANSGWTDCPNLNQSIYGTTDVREFLAGGGWGIGFGDLFGNFANIKTFVEGDPSMGNWSSDWQPHVFGLYVHLGQAAMAAEAGYVFLHEHDCYDVSGSSSPLAKPTDAGSLEGYVGPREIGVPSIDWIVFNPDALL